MTDAAHLHGVNLEPMAARFAAMPAGEAEGLIDAYVAQAVAQWRVADATFWQRVKFRARLIRATLRGRDARGPADPNNGVQSC